MAAVSTVIVQKQRLAAAFLLVVVGSLVGAAIAQRPVLIMGACAGAGALLLLNESRLGGLLLVGAWPAYVLPPRLTAPVTVALGVALLARVSSRALFRSLLLDRQAWADISLAVAFGVIAAASSLPISSLSLTRLILFVCVCLPCFMTGRTIGSHELVRGATWMGAPLVVWGVLVSGVIGHVNPIAFAQAAGVTGLAYFVCRAGVVRVAAVLSALILVATTGKLGPTVAFAAGALYVIVTSVFGGTTTSTAKKFVIGVPIGVAALFVLAYSYNAARHELLANDPSAQSRVAVARFALGNASILGAGGDSLGSERLEDRYVVRYAHNFILDAVVVGGVLGAVPITVLIARAAVRTRRSRDKMLAPFVCVLVGSLFSGGVLENWAMWLALGALLGPAAKTRHQTARTS